MTLYHLYFFIFNGKGHLNCGIDGHSLVSIIFDSSQYIYIYFFNIYIYFLVWEYASTPYIELTQFLKCYPGKKRRKKSIAYTIVITHILLVAKWWV